ncbi:hypothetical protein HBA54_12475 [Pelagibius litoralis]|uniref:YCII-related domain-containing protein n=1 Tax=Pelagibius litoralis TaxID=374515 RepID=A0A967EXT8_9PROT|nr:YciI family protein [Pelagibius litoralis]NIA69408.1 hypothetical protein [Pelagibius litoralis]
MPSWEAYKRTAKERGALALELFVVESVPAETSDEVRANLPEHLEYQRSLEAAGKLAFAGPLSDPTGELMQGTGLIVYRAGSFEEAQELAADDPMHRCGARRFTLRRWLVNEGSLSLSVGLSTKSVDLS